MKNTESQIGNPTGPTDHDLRATDQNVVEAEVGTMPMEKKVSLRLSYRLDRVPCCRLPGLSVGTGGFVRSSPMS